MLTFRWILWYGFAYSNIVSAYIFENWFDGLIFVVELSIVGLLWTTLIELLLNHVRRLCRPCWAARPITLFFELHKVIFVHVSKSRLPLQVEEQINTAILWPHVSYTHVFLAILQHFNLYEFFSWSSAFYGLASTLDFHWLCKIHEVHHLEIKYCTRTWRLFFFGKIRRENKQQMSDLFQVFWVKWFDGLVAAP